MDYKTILVHIDGADKSHSAVLCAVDIARQCEAQLHGVYILPSMDSSIALVSSGRGPEVIKQWRLEVRELGEMCERKYREFLQSRGVEWVWKMLDAHGDNIGQELADYSRCVDLSVVAQTQKHEDVLVASEYPEKLLLLSGGPVVVVPQAYSETKTIGQRVIVCWDRSQESARAVKDSLPLLTRAEYVVAVWVNDEPEDSEATMRRGRGLQEQLSRHGVDLQFASIEKGEDDIGPRLIQYALQQEADLIVAGGYGESRLKEFLLQGVTRHLLRESPLPILFSH